MRGYAAIEKSKTLQQDGAQSSGMVRTKRDALVNPNFFPEHVRAKEIKKITLKLNAALELKELAVRNVVHGAPVRNLEALANPEALEYFRDRPELLT